MGQTVILNQSNTDGDNNAIIKFTQDIFRPYEKVLSVGEEKKFLDDASENLIRDGKLHLNETYINKVKQFLDDKKFCLIKAPEGRGKTYLSRIIAYDYHKTRGMDVFFLDFKDFNSITVNNIDDVLQEWHKNNQKQYLLVLENAHAYKDLQYLRDRINGWINSNENCFWFLLNSRPTDIELDDFSDWEEIVELNPNKDDVNDIINLFSKEVGRKPFAKKKQRDFFVEKIYPNKKKVSGANLRLLKIYLETWQNHDEIHHISDVSERTVIEEFRRLYLAHRKRTEIEALWYISSLFQFDIPLHEDFVQNVGNLVEDGLLRFEENRYYLPHSVDATFLYQAICDYKHKNYVDQMRIFADSFVKKILENNCPRDFEGDFKLLTLGLLARKDEFKNIFYLTHEDIAKEIITKLNPSFVQYFFQPKNHEEPNPELLLNYYLNNKGWLKPLFQELSHSPLMSVSRTFKKHLGYSNIIKDIFEDTKDLDDYLTAKLYKALIAGELLTPFINLSDGHKSILIKHYKKNKEKLKPIYLGLSPQGLSFVYKAYLTHLNINIVEYIFEDTKDLDDYLRANLSSALMGKLFVPIINLGSRYESILIEHYEKDKDMLKSIFRRLSPPRLFFVYKAFKTHLNINIAKDIFDDAKDLDDYLRADNCKVLTDYLLFAPIIKLCAGHKTILIEHYNENKDMLKRYFLRFSPTGLFVVYQAYNTRFRTNIVKDIFDDAKDLNVYLNTSKNYKVLIDRKLLIPIIKCGAAHKTILIKQYKKNRDILKPILRGLTPTSLVLLYNTYMSLHINIVKDIFNDLDALEEYLKNHDVRMFQHDYVLRAIEKLGDEHKQVLYKYNAFDHFFYSTNARKKGFCVSPSFIEGCWRKKRTFDVSKIRNNKFNIVGISWAYLEKFVSLIQKNITEDNRQHSIRLVKAINKMVLDKENAFSYASAKDLSLFYYNIASIDEAIFREITGNKNVLIDIERRLKAPSYSIQDLYLFDHFFSQSWCKSKLGPRILNADKAQKKIINAWHDEFLKKLADRGGVITSGSLLDYIHHNLGLANSLSEDDL